jgi:hypothetical protein
MATGRGLPAYPVPAAAVQIWVLDVRSPESEREAHRQSAAVAGSEHAGDDQAFIDAAIFDDD